MSHENTSERKNLLHHIYFVDHSSCRNCADHKIGLPSDERKREKGLARVAGPFFCKNNSCYILSSSL